MRKEDEKVLRALTDWQLMGLCIEREAGGEPREGRIGVGTVILERVEHRSWDGKTIKDVILWPWQFSWTMPEAGEKYYEEAVRIAKDWTEEYRKRVSLQECAAIATCLIQGTVSRDSDIAAGHCCQYVATRYRKYTDEHPDEKGTRWWKGMRLLKTIDGPKGGHEFYV